MAAAIDATVGGASANSFALLAEALAYFDERLGGNIFTDFLSTADAQIRALITATRNVNAQLYRGTRASSTQALELPRLGMYQGGLPIASTIIPLWAKQAEYEEALAVAVASGLDNDKDALARTGLEAFTSLGVGDIKLDIREQDPNAAHLNLLSPLAYRLIRPYIVTDVLSEPPGGARNFRITR